MAEDSFGIDAASWGAMEVAARFRKENVWDYRDDALSRKRAMLTLMQRMTASAAAIDALLVVVHMPRLERGRTDSAPSELVDAIGEDTLFLDLSDAVREYYSDADRASLRFERDGHPNRIAHELIAREISKLLESEGLF